jgi:hypothetical protein
MPYSIRIAIRVLLIEDTVRVLCRLFTTCKYINRIIFILFYVQHVSTILDIRRAWFPLSNRHMKWMWSIECQHLIIKNEKENDCIDLEVSYFFKVTGAFLLFNFLFFQVISLSLIVFFLYFNRDNNWSWWWWRRHADFWTSDNEANIYTYAFR